MQRLNKARFITPVGNIDGFVVIGNQHLSEANETYWNREPAVENFRGEAISKALQVT